MVSISLLTMMREGKINECPREIPEAEGEDRRVVEVKGDCLEHTLSSKTGFCGLAEVGRVGGARGVPISGYLLALLLPALEPHFSQPLPPSLSPSFQF